MPTGIAPYPSVPGFTQTSLVLGGGGSQSLGALFDRAAYHRGANQILAGYGDIANRVMSGLRGSNQAELLDIYDQYVRAGAQQKQQAITAGLRNTTKSRLTTPSTLLGQKWRAESASNSALARAIADYEARIGLQGLGAAGTFFGQENQLALNYAQLAQQAELTREGFANQRSLAAGRGGGGGGSSGGGGRGGGGSRGGSVPWFNIDPVRHATGPMGSNISRQIITGDYGGDWFGPGDYPGRGGGGGGGGGGYPFQGFPAAVANAVYGDPFENYPPGEDTPFAPQSTPETPYQPESFPGGGGDEGGEIFMENPETGHWWSFNPETGEYESWNGG